MLHLRILTTDKTVYDGQAVELMLPTEAGMIGVLSHHSPLVTIVKSGKMVVKKETETLTFTVTGGVLEVRPGSEVIVLAHTVVAE